MFDLGVDGHAVEQAGEHVARGPGIKVAREHGRGRAASFCGRGERRLVGHEDGHSTAVVCVVVEGVEGRSVARRSVVEALIACCILLRQRAAPVG